MKKTLKGTLKSARIEPEYAFHESVEDALMRLPAKQRAQRPLYARARLSAVAICAALLMCALPFAYHALSPVKNPAQHYAQPDNVQPGPISVEQTAADQPSSTVALPPEWHNILLLGTDAPDMQNRYRSDTIMIASINTQTGQLKLVSIMGDAMVEIPDKGIQKFNTLTYDGGPELAMQVINENLGMNITEYAIVNFAGLSNIVDLLDGVFVDITEEEMNDINRHIGEIARYTMDRKTYMDQRKNLRLLTSGPGIRLSGIQAMSYARTRYVGDGDDERTQRQRRVLLAIVDRVKDASTIQLTQLATSIWSCLHTNIGMLNAVGLAQTVLKNGGNTDDIMDWRLPGVNTYTSETRGRVSALWDVDYAANADRLHQFIILPETAPAGNQFIILPETTPEGHKLAPLLVPSEAALSSVTVDVNAHSSSDTEAGE